MLLNGVIQNLLLDGITGDFFYPQESERIKKWRHFLGILRYGLESRKSVF